METYVEKLKAKNPMINQILCEQERHKWEITRGSRYKTVSDTSAYRESFEKFANFKTNTVCPLGVKY